MHSKLPKPSPKAHLRRPNIVCLSRNASISRGHVVIVWKEDVPDLHRLAERDYNYLMDTVNSVRNAMLKALKIEKYTLFIWMRCNMCIGT